MQSINKTFHLHVKLDPLLNKLDSELKANVFQIKARFSHTRNFKTVRITFRITFCSRKIYYDFLEIF